jgi:hypothetical protein
LGKGKGTDYGSVKASIAETFLVQRHSSVLLPAWAQRPDLLATVPLHRFVA